MMRLTVLVFLVWGGYTNSDCVVHAQTNVGREFVFAYAENYLPNSDPTVIITNMSPLDHENVTVTITSPVHGLLRTIQLQGFGSFEQVTLTREVVPFGSDPVTVAIIVQADDDIAVYALNDAHDRSMDGFTVLPVSSLGTEYFVASYTPSLSSQMIIVATESDTTIRIELSNVATYKNRDLKKGGIILIDAHHHEAFMVDGSTDLTGTQIQANKPIAVLTGNRCAFIPTGVLSCDHLVEMLPPFSQWGKKFVAMPFLGRSTGAIYRVIAGRDKTEVNIKSQKIELQQMGFWEFKVSVGQTSYLESNKPVQVVQYTKGFDADGVIGDPAMTIVPPMEQSVSLVKLPTYNTTKDLSPVQNYVNIYAPCTEMYYSNLTLDGTVIRDIVPAERIARVDRSDYCAVGFHLEHGLHIVAPGSMGGRESFVALAYGFADMNSYAWPAGLATRSITCEYVAPSGEIGEYSCDKALFVVNVPCNDTDIPGDYSCELVDCIQVENVIYICAGVAVLAIVAQKLFSHFVIQKTKPPKQIAFGQVGQKIPPPDIAISDSNHDLSEVAKTTHLSPPSPSAQQRTPRQERADRMRRNSRTPSPSPDAYD